MNTETFDIVPLPDLKPPVQRIPPGHEVPAGTYITLTESETAFFQDPCISEAERARRLVQITQNHIKAEMKAGNWDNVKELRKVGIKG